ncbi:Ras modification protein ERF4, partial [Stagonosporopsis vannaccii]
QHPPPSAPREPNVPVERPRSERDEYPLLTLPQRHQSRQSPAPSSLVVERSTAGDDVYGSGRTSIGLPRDHPRGRTSPHLEHASRSPTPGPSMSVAHDAAPPAAPQYADAHDVEAAKRQPPQSSGGRVSLPGSGRTSLSRSQSQRTNADGDDASEFPWGPSHPCFPHPNPHVPLNSHLYESTRVIRIKRDWMVKGDLAPTFANLYPEILDPLITEDDFRDLVKKINDSLIAAFDPFTFRAWLDAVMGVATFWLWEDVGLSGVKKQLDHLESWIDRWNREVGQKEAVKIIPLRRTGYLTLDIQIPDPHLGPDNGTISRPDTQDDDFGHVARQKTDEYENYVIPTPTLQVNSMPPAIETQS